MLYKREFLRLCIICGSLFFLLFVCGCSERVLVKSESAYSELEGSYLINGHEVTIGKIKYMVGTSPAFIYSMEATLPYNIHEYGKTIIVDSEKVEIIITPTSDMARMAFGNGGKVTITKDKTNGNKERIDL